MRAQGYGRSSDSYGHTCATNKAAASWVGFRNWKIIRYRDDRPSVGEHWQLLAPCWRLGFQRVRCVTCCRQHKHTKMLALPLPFGINVPWFSRACGQINACHSKT